MPLDFSNIEFIRQDGFSGFVSVQKLFEDCSVIPPCPGVYLILVSTSYQPNFLEQGCGGFFKGKNPNVSTQKLQAKWVKDAIVLYIGKAGGSNSASTLRSRLQQYFNFGKGKPVGHWGGRYIWQLSDIKQLVVCWKELTNQEPRIIEKQLITAFVSKYGCMPFANLAG